MEEKIERLPRLIEECQLCESRNIIETKIESYGSAYLYVGWRNTASLFSRVCLDCGNVVQIYTKTPQKLVKREKKK